MKKSITKKIVMKMVFLVSVAIVILSLVTFFVVRETVISNQTTLSKRNLDVVKNAVKLSFMSNDVGLLDEDFGEQFKKTAQDMCNEYNLDYIYVYSQNFQNEKIKYEFIAGSDKTSDKIPKNYRDLEIDEKYSNDIQKLWNGELEYLKIVYNSEYGYEMGMLTIIDDYNGNKAFLGVDTPYTDIYSRMLLWFVCTMLFVIALLILGIIGIYRTIQKLIVKPVNQICNIMDSYTTTHIVSNVHIENMDTKELSMILSSFNQMSDEINRYIESIKLLSQEREKQKAEMRVAEQIQKGLLPKPKYETNSFVLEAMMKPAREVGGDLYDYLDIDEYNTLIVIADVSGKGVTASMFMAMTLTLIRQLAKMKKSPQEILTLVNSSLSKNNSQMMFVTAFVAVYNKLDSTLTYSNAGHNYPYIIKGAELITIDDGKGVPLGLFDDEEYSQKRILLKPDDILYLYTDGVNEAVNKDKEFYTIQRLEALLKKFSVSDCISLVDCIYNSIIEFVGDAVQSDDFTMLTMKIKENGILLDANVKEFEKIKTIIINSDIPKEYKLKICLACEEWFDNICMYSYNENDQNKKVRFMMDTSDSVTITFEDWGKKYNPLENVITKEEYDMDNQIGGLGKLIIVTIADDVVYDYVDGKNRLTITVKTKEN